MAVPDTERLISWARYLHWADIARVRFQELNDKSTDADPPEESEILFALMSQWYASLWVVIEGWKEVPLEDKIIDELLTTQADLLALLKRYRNGVFHFQPSVIDNRFLDFLKKGEESVFLVGALHSEFLRFLWEFPASLLGTPEQIQELRTVMASFLGWWPSGIPHARIEKLRTEAKEAIALSFSGIDPSSTASQELRDSAQAAIVLADRMLDELKDGIMAAYLRKENEIKTNGGEQPSV